MTNEELSRLKALAEAATPGPWFDGGGNVYREVNPDPSKYKTDEICDYARMCDVAFIIAARTAVPTLIAFAEKLKADNADPLAAHDAQGMMLTNLRCEVDRLTKDLDACSVHADALAQSLAVFERGHTCACSYDKSTDICIVHSPQLVAANKEVERLRTGIKSLAARADCSCRPQLLILLKE